MHSFLNKCIFIFLTAVPVFSQTADREQGLMTFEPLWRQALGGEILSLPDVQAQSAVVALDSGSIKAYSTSGTPIWSYSARGRISPFVTRSREGTSYLSRTNGTLIAVNRSGRELWRRNIGSPLSAKVVSGWDGRLFVPADKNIFCYTASGNLLWTRSFNYSISIPPKLDCRGGIIFALENNDVYRIDHFGSAYVWSLPAAPAVLLSVEELKELKILVLYRDGTMGFLGDAQEWYMTAQGNINVSLLPRLPSPPLAAASRESNAAAILSNGSVVLVCLKENKILWNASSHSGEIIRQGGAAEQEAELIYDERGIFILTRNGVSGFSHDGRRLWYMYLQNTAAIPALGDDGVLYSGGKDWILSTFKVENRVLQSRNSIYGPVPDGSYKVGISSPPVTHDIPLLDFEIRNRLEQINAAVNSGRVGVNESSWKSLLLAISSDHEDIQIRIKALRLLGQIGSRETIPLLVGIFRKETEPLVKAAAVSAIGSIGVDPDGIAIQTFIYTLAQSQMKDEQVLSAIASATGALCRFSGPPLSETGIKLLNLLTESSKPSSVRRLANRELASLK